MHFIKILKIINIYSAAVWIYGAFGPVVDLFLLGKFGKLTLDWRPIELWEISKTFILEFYIKAKAIIIPPWEFK